MDAKVDYINKMFTDLSEKKSDCPEQELPTVTEEIPVAIFPATSSKQFQINEDILSRSSEISPARSITQLFYN